MGRGRGDGTDRLDGQLLESRLVHGGRDIADRQAGAGYGEVGTLQLRRLPQLTTTAIDTTVIDKCLLSYNSARQFTLVCMVC